MTTKRHPRVAIDRARKAKCRTCDESHIIRKRRPGVCLTCDMLQRHADGETPKRIAARFDLPRFLTTELLQRRGLLTHQETAK